MRKYLTSPVFIGIAVFILGSVAYLAAPHLQRAFFYPVAPPMPAQVAEEVEVLFGQLEAILEERAPKALAVLNPGLTTEELAEIEQSFGITLPEEIRELYRWRNGQSHESLYYIVPGHHFMPLEEALSERQLMEENLAEAGALQRFAFSVFAGHRRTWISIFDDLAGDGYFLDVERGGEPGHFFFHMSHFHYYEFFPSVRNFLAGLIECYSREAIWFDEEEDATIADYEASDRIWARFAAITE